MAQWAKVQKLPVKALQEVQQMYCKHYFPIEVRHFLAPWIENNIMNCADHDSRVQHEQNASLIVKALLSELELKVVTLTDNEEFFVAKIKLQEAAETLRERYDRNPLALLQIVWKCLDIELKLVQQADNVLFSGNPTELLIVDTSNQTIMKQIGLLRHRTQDIGAYLKCSEQEQKAFDRTKTQSDARYLETKVAKLFQMRINISKKHEEILVMIETLQAKVLDDELIRWKRAQQLAGNGVPFASNKLDSIQEWCEALIEIIWLNRQQIKESEHLWFKNKMMHSNFAELNKRVTKLLSSLVTSIFIIERQPPQVIKTNNRFTVMVRLLIGGQLNLHLAPPKVTVSIINEEQANTLLKNDKMSKPEFFGEILNNSNTMEYQKETRKLYVSFGNLHLSKIKRSLKKKFATESVMEEKCSLLFQSKFSIGLGDLIFQVWTLSLPVVVIVHGNQESHSWATVTWDNAFAELGRPPFVVPYKVPWSRAAEMLSTKFNEATGRCLTEANLSVLAAKILRNTHLQGPDNDITWFQFSKEPLPGRNSFTFWDWFYAIMKLTHEYLRELWKDNAIVGFVGRLQTEDMLKQCKPGTFLLRFSDSELGGITIAWVGDQREVFMVQPFTSKDLVIRKLADRISDLKHLLFLYPDVPKDVVFGKYYTPFTDNQQPTNGYVKPSLVTHLPGYNINVL